MADVKDSWFFTGNERTAPCGCEWREMAPADGHAEKLWINGKDMCDRHRDRIAARVKELQDQGRLPRSPDA